MKLVFLCKRHYMSKDVLEDHYGRLYEIPAGLASVYNVDLVLLSYRRDGDDVLFSGKPGFRVSSISSAGVVCRIVRWVSVVLSTLRRRDRKTVLVGSSDVFNIIMGSAIASIHNVTFVADLYDNYESFGLAKMPFLRFFYWRALKSASVITCVSHPLAEYVRGRLGDGSDIPIVVIESTIGKGDFLPFNKQSARKKLLLPKDKVLIGYAGALSSSRDIEVLYQAFKQLKCATPEAALVLAGVVDGSCSIPEGPGIYYLGALDHGAVADLYAALDVGVICLKDSDFGRYAFPQKAYEMISMRIPLAVTNVGAMGELFKSFPSVLYEAGNAEDLTRVLQRQLDEPVIVDMDIPTWEDQAKKMKAVLEDVVARARL